MKWYNFSKKKKKSFVSIWAFGKKNQKRVITTGQSTAFAFLIGLNEQ